MSALRVYLLADFGKGPRVKTRFPRVCFHHTEEGRDRCGSCIGTGFSIASRIARARRWWLVECENAEAGRRVIRCNGMTACEGAAPTGCDGDTCPSGRILDSGGAA